MAEGTGIGGREIVINTQKYRVSFIEKSGGSQGPVGNEAKIFKGIGEPVSDSIYKKISALADANDVRLTCSMKDKRLDSARNSSVIEQALDEPEKAAIVSGRKPSGPCHIGHKLVAENVGLMQELDIKVFMPLADLEAHLDPKIGEKKFYLPISADNILDWGASGIVLDAAHVYYQSEENMMFQMAYFASRGLTFKLCTDIYGPDEMEKNFCFIFAGMAQVGDIVLPQAYGKKYSLMLAGPDQDGHMSMTTRLSEKLVENVQIQTAPGTLYVSHMPAFYVLPKEDGTVPSDDEKMSASKEEGSLYLGPLRNHYDYPAPGTKKLREIKYLSIDERITENMDKLKRGINEQPGRFQKFMATTNDVLNEFKENNITLENLEERVITLLVEHRMKRAAVLAYACKVAMDDPLMSNEDKNKAKKLSDRIGRDDIINEHEFGKRPKFWKVKPQATEKGISPWHSKLLEYGDQIVL